MSDDHVGERVGERETDQRHQEGGPYGPQQNPRVQRGREELDVIAE